MLTEPPSRWNIERIVAETFVAQVEVHETLASTNDRALQLAAEPELSLPLLVIAEQQTSGRGRGKNAWWSSSGSLTFSLLLKLDSDQLPTARWPEMSLTVGSSLCEALSRILPGEPLGLKWPNDVYLRGSKVCGVLVEIPASTSGRAVVGVGVNVANAISTAPEELQHTAIALCDVGVSISREDVLVEVLREFDRQLELLRADPEAVRRCWRTFDLLIGRSVTLSDGIADLTGTCVGIDDDGALLLRTEAGTRRCYGGVVQSFL